MVVQLRPRAITVERGSRGFGLSLIYRGLDKYEEKDTGIFVARVVPGGQAARYGVREDDKVSVMSTKKIFFLNYAGHNCTFTMRETRDTLYS